MKTLKCGLWHCAVWINWFFKETYYGHGHYSSPAKDTVMLVAFGPVLLALSLVTAPIWLPCLLCWWIYMKIRAFAEGPSPCAVKETK